MGSSINLALVTGANGGIGRALVEQLVDAGVRTIATCRDANACTEIEKSLANGSKTVIGRVLDLRDWQKIGVLFDELAAEYGIPDVVINNAGVGYAGPVVGGDPQLWTEMFLTNVIGLAHCSSVAVDRMRKAKIGGHIVNISSLAAYRLAHNGTMYSASKSAVRVITEGLRQELLGIEPQIRVSCVSPGYVDTGFASKFYHGIANSLPVEYPILSPNDVANSVLYILSQPAHVQVHDILLRPTQQPP